MSDRTAVEVEGVGGRRTSFFRRLFGVLQDERVRFLLVGGINTVLGYGLFVLFELTTGPYLGYFFSLYASFFLASTVAFVLHRYYTFKVAGTGNAFVDYIRFLSVYIVALALNTVALPLFVEVVGMSPLVAQALIVVVTTLTSYFGHKYFSFRRKKIATVERAEHQVGTQ